MYFNIVLLIAVELQHITSSQYWKDKPSKIVEPRLNFFEFLK